MELEPYKNTIKLEGADLNYVIVMDCGAGYDLHDFISHQNVAGKDLPTVMAIAKEIALCLKFLNETCGIIHGDVKARNFVAKGFGFIGFAAIDLDNASTIGREPAGLKQTSSGYLPPEQAAVVASFCSCQICLKTQITMMFLFSFLPRPVLYKITQWER